MAEPFKRDGVWVVKWKDGAGKWKTKRTDCQTKEAARRLVEDLERQAERQRLGLEPLPQQQAQLTFGELLDWWLKEYGRRLKSQTVVPFAEKHLRKSLGPLALVDVTADRLEGLLNSKRDDLKPESLNHLRSLVGRIFGQAIRRKRWQGTNPVEAVPRYRVPKRLPAFLAWNEVAPTLAQLAEDVRPVFALALYAGLRKGEVLGLRRSDVDLEGKTVAVQRSYDNDTTKGGHADLLPMAEELRPYLVAALSRAKGELLFPAPNGKTYKVGQWALDKILRRAMGRAGIVRAFEQRCRRKGCGYKVEAQQAEPGNCPRCGKVLWLKPLPRHIRFHDLRHTTATLLLKAGEPIATVQLIMRHASPETTLERYGHLDLDDARKSVNALQFQPAQVVAELEAQPARAAVGADVGASQMVVDAEVVELQPQAALEVAAFGAPVVRSESSPEGGKTKAPESVEIPGPSESGRLDLNQRPLAPQARRLGLDGLAGHGNGSQPLENTGAEGRAGLDGLADSPPLVTPFGAPVVRTRLAPIAPLLTLQEVAEVLGVHRATVHRLCERGELPSVRVLNSLRVRPADLEAFLAKQVGPGRDDGAEG